MTLEGIASDDSGEAPRTDDDIDKGEETSFLVWKIDEADGSDLVLERDEREGNFSVLHDDSKVGVA